jgi:OOP family OmpA-OmpF porin
VIEAIAGTLRGCPETAFEIAGHTDSQGSESGNLRLSQDRAEAVLAALRALGLPLAGSVAQGYGEAEPVAGNDTAEGRAQNRRIAFAPIEPEEAVAEGDGPAAEGAATACLQAVDAVLAKGSVQFSAGSETLAPESGAVLDAIAEALRGCPDVAMEIGGYTDSEGAESWNQQLSQKRAEAVLAALRERDLPLPDVTARGYGETAPVADNATAEGRAQNRRIAFTLVTAEGDGSQ